MKRRAVSQRWFAGIAVLSLVAVFGIVGTGCEQNEATEDLLGTSAALSETGGVGDLSSAGAFGDLTIEAIDSRVDLTEEQREPMQVALGRLQAAHQERMESRGRAGAGRQGRAGRFGGAPEAGQVGERPVMVFLEEAAGILTGEQFVGLAEMMKEKRDAFVAQNGGRGKGFGSRHGGGPGIGPGDCRGDGPGQGPGSQIFEQLDLSEEQRVQIERIFEGRREQVQAIHEQVRSGGLDREEAREQLRTIREESRAEVEAILTPEQLAEWEALRLERMAERIDRRIERMDQNLDRRVEFIENVLDLTSDQTAQVRQIFEDSVDARREILEQVKAGSLEMPEAADQIREIMEGVADSIGALLTPEQQEIWDALQELLPRRGR